MSDAIRQEGPLVRFDLRRRATAAAPADAGVIASDRAFLGHLNLRGDPGDSAFLEAVKTVLGLTLPLEPNTVSKSGDLVACWLGPDEWLIVTPGERDEEIKAALVAALKSHFAAVTVISGGQTVVALEGPRVREVLARGCTLDLHPRVFGPGSCAQTLLGKAPVLIRQVSAAPGFELIVRRSFADYLWRWLEAAARDEGLAVAGEAKVTVAPPAAPVAAD